MKVRLPQRSDMVEEKELEPGVAPIPPRRPDPRTASHDPEEVPAAGAGDAAREHRISHRF